MKVLEYIVLHENSTTNLENNVNSYLKKGWQLQGGVATCKGFHGEVYYTQAIIKTDKQ